MKYVARMELKPGMVAAENILNYKNEIIVAANTKIDAVRVAKSMMKTVREDMVCEQVYKVLEPKNVAFTLNYVPSAGTKLGKYVVFGN